MVSTTNRRLLYLCQKVHLKCLTLTFEPMTLKKSVNQSINWFICMAVQKLDWNMHTTRTVTQFAKLHRWRLIVRRCVWKKWFCKPRWLCTYQRVLFAVRRLLIISESRLTGHQCYVISFMIIRQRVPEKGEQMPPKVLIWLCAVSLWPWSLTFWSQMLSSSSSPTAPMLWIWQNSHEQFVRYRASKLFAVYMFTDARRNRKQNSLGLYIKKNILHKYVKMWTDWNWHANFVS